MRVFRYNEVTGMRRIALPYRFYAVVLSCCFLSGTVPSETWAEVIYTPTSSFTPENAPLYGFGGRSSSGEPAYWVGSLAQGAGPSGGDALQISMSGQPARSDAHCESAGNEDDCEGDIGWGHPG